MSYIPNAPYIQDAEMNGVPDHLPVCPHCGKEASEFYFYKDGTDVLGCDRCITWLESWETEEGRN